MVSVADIRVAAPKLSIRSQLMDAIQTTLQNLDFNPDAPTGVKMFDTVLRGATIDDLQPRMVPACGLEEGTEKLDPGIYLTQTKTLRVFFNIKVVYVVGVDASDLINYYFSQIVKTFVSQPNFANLTISVEEAGNTLQYLGITDPEPGGTLYLDFQYRHKLDDPFTQE
jgi:hypothetical protein